jgi:hypothetical protein
MDFFKTCASEAEAKILFKKLAMKHHPDRGGDVETMKTLNNEYQAFLKSIDGTSRVSEDGKTRTYKFDGELEQALADKILALISVGLADDLDCFLVGSWLWVVGDTKPHKEKLKELEFKWHAVRKCWFFNLEKGVYRKSGHLGEIFSEYGASKIKKLDSQNISSTRKLA